MTGNRKLSIIWHFHQPTFIPDYEVREKVSESYMNILNIHEELEIPFCLNITGALLERLLVLQPKFIDYVKHLIKKNFIELLASAYYHPVLPLLSYEDAKMQIEKDIEIKRMVFNTPLKGFWPTELAWTHWLIPLLKKEKLRWAILDTSALILSNTLPEWSNRNVQGMKVLSPELKTIALKQEIYQPYFTEFLNDKLAIIFRDHKMSVYLTEFKKGVIYNETLIEDYIRKITNDVISGGLLVIADDGERVNAQTARVYKKLLKKFTINNKISFHTPTLFLENNPPMESRYFPASTFQYDLKAWISTMDDETYLLFLRQVSEKIRLLKYLSKLQEKNPKAESYLKKAEEMLLKAEDSSCLFWRFLQRTRKPCYEYVYKALSYVNKGLEELQC